MLQGIYVILELIVSATTFNSVQALFPTIQAQSKNEDSERLRSYKTEEVCDVEPNRIIFSCGTFLG